MISAGIVTRRSAAGDTAAAPADVMAVHRLREHHIAACVEAAHQLRRVMVEIRLHLVTPAPPGVLTRLRGAAEPGGQFRLAAVRHMRDAPGETETGLRPLTGRGVVVVTAPPAGVRPDRGQLHRAPGDLVGRGGRRARQDQQ